MTVDQAIDRIIAICEPPNADKYRRSLYRLQEHELKAKLEQLEAEQSKHLGLFDWRVAARRR